MRVLQLQGMRQDLALQDLYEVISSAVEGDVAGTASILPFLTDMNPVTE